MKLISVNFNDGDKLPARHVFNGMGYEGDNISPHLTWDEVPPGTKSFAVTCYDPDAPTGSGWWHWIVANLPADTRVLPQGAAPARLTCRTARFRRAPISAPQAMAARRRQKAKRTVIFSRCMRWMWSVLRSMKTPAARWSGLMCTSTGSPAPR